MSSKREDNITTEINKLFRKHRGKLTKEDIVNEAENKKSPLHVEFEWDDAKAGHLHRLERAGELFRYCTVVVRNGGKTVTAPAYVHDPDAPGNRSGYVETLATRRVESSRKIVLAELQRCEYAIERARNVAAALSLEHPALEIELERMLKQIIVFTESLAA